MADSGARERSVGFLTWGRWVGASKSMYYRTDVGSLVPKSNSLNFCR